MVPGGNLGGGARALAADDSGGGGPSEVPVVLRDRRLELDPFRLLEKLSWGTYWVLPAQLGCPLPTSVSASSSSTSSSLYGFSKLWF